jgi:hypothetical protein
MRKSSPRSRGARPGPRCWQQRCRQAKGTRHAAIRLVAAVAHLFRARPRGPRRLHPASSGPTRRRRFFGQGQQRSTLSKSCCCADFVHGFSRATIVADLTGSSGCVGHGLVETVSLGATLGSATPQPLIAAAAQLPPRRRSSTGGFDRLVRKKIPTDPHHGVDVIRQSTSTGQRLNMPPFENSQASLADLRE